MTINEALALSLEDLDRRAAEEVMGWRVVDVERNGVTGTAIQHPSGHFMAFEPSTNWNDDGAVLERVKALEAAARSAFNRALDRMWQMRAIANGPDKCGFTTRGPINHRPGDYARAALCAMSREGD